MTMCPKNWFAFYVVAMVFATLTSCTTKNKNSDIIKQAKPTIMIIPSDNFETLIDGRV